MMPDYRTNDGRCTEKCLDHATRCYPDAISFGVQPLSDIYVNPKLKINAKYQTNFAWGMEELRYT